MALDHTAFADDPLRPYAAASVEPLLVDVERGETLESRHRVHAVALREGAIVAAAGDPGVVTFMRSAAKPLQALPLARAREDLGEAQLAIACASHLADEAQLAAVRSLLAAAPASPEELECGPAGDPPERIKHNCSGKHAGMLALCRARGWESSGYRLAGHPVQEEMLKEVAGAADIDAPAIPTAVDGCGVLTFALPLERMAAAFSRLFVRDGGERVTAAMRARPELIRGGGAADTELMRALPGWVAKGGAEGLFCAAGPDGTAIALKCEDGNGRALKPALAALLGRIGITLDQSFTHILVHNSRGESVGSITAADA
jgi:L-asparaginase II